MKKLILLALLPIIGFLVWQTGVKFDRLAHESEMEKKNALRQWEEETTKLNETPAKLREVDRVIFKGDWSKAETLLGDLEKVVPQLRNQVNYRRAAILYRSCEQHVVNFFFFADNKRKEEAGEERDQAGRQCSEAKAILELLAASAKDKTELFYYKYALGNLNVRRAGLAVSQEELMDALAGAISSYMEALRAKDDYETKFNLELLLALEQQAKNAGKGKEGKSAVDPQEFQIKPARPGGASPSSRSKSKL